MNTHSGYGWRRQLVWGLLMIGFGVAVLLDRMDLFEMEGLWHYWPFVLVVIGINKMIGFPTAKHFTDGLWMVFLGLWVFACFENLYGLTFRNSWPLIIIATGVTMTLEPLMRARFAANKEQDNEK